VREVDRYSHIDSRRTPAGPLRHLPPNTHNKLAGLNLLLIHCIAGCRRKEVGWHAALHAIEVPLQPSEKTTCQRLEFKRAGHGRTAVATQQGSTLWHLALLNGAPAMSESRANTPKPTHMVSICARQPARKPAHWTRHAYHPQKQAQQASSQTVGQKLHVGAIRYGASWNRLRTSNI
jgi:hypothetical protein